MSVVGLRRPAGRNCRTAATSNRPTLASAAGEPGTVEKLKAGAEYGGKKYQVHLDGCDQTALLSGKTDKSARKTIFYYDETVLTAIRYDAFKITFSLKEGGHWDDPLVGLGRPMITNLRMDPFERQTGDLNRQYAEHKTWVLTPMLGVTERHLQSFRDFPIRQLGLSAQMGKVIEGIQSQILKIRPQH